jgi:hypothetical protein
MISSLGVMSYGQVPRKFQNIGVHEIVSLPNCKDLHAFQKKEGLAQRL